MTALYRGALLFASALCVSSCSSMVTSRSTHGQEQDVDPSHRTVDYVYRLPKTIIEIVIASGSGKFEDVAVTTKQVPDPAQEYRLSYLASSFSNDHLVIDRATGAWTLGSVNGSADDQTATALNSLAKSLGRIQGQGLGEFLEDATPPKPLLLADFDPFDPVSRDAAKAVLKTAHLDFKCLDCSGKPSARLEGDIDGIPTRTKSAHHLLICEESCEAPDRKKRLVAFEAFNDSPIFALRVGRSIFVKQDTTITFSDGEVAKVDINKPSEVARAAALPGEIVGSFVTGVTEGLTSQQTLAGDEQKAIEAKMALRDKQLAQQKAEIENARQRQCLSSTPPASCNATSASSTTTTTTTTAAGAASPSTSTPAATGDAPPPH